MRSVSLAFTLVGRTQRKKDFLKELSNYELLQNTIRQINFQFGDRPVHILRENQLKNEHSKYPEFYVAGWFVSKDPIENTDGGGSELVIISHGRKIEDAKKELMEQVLITDWEQLAQNV